ncbi:MAG: DUF6671 family protein [Psychroflexus maritimus]
MSTLLFKNRKLVIATKHKKEKVIAPLLEKHLGVTCFVDKKNDTDSLGTFSGEIERKLDPVSNLRKKCLLAMDANNCDLGVASEGSFGPHPTIFFAHADDEFLIFIDKKNNLEIIARELSIETNFNGKTIETEEELLDFAASVNFPSHGLILKKTKEDQTQISKGITELNILKKTFKKLINKFNSVYVETDMRAMYNPTRMNIIKKTTEKLVEKVNSCCPECNTPGFSLTTIKKGLKCKLCGLPTKSTLSYLYKCQGCQYITEEKYPHKKTTEDPMYCDYCNP